MSDLKSQFMTISALKGGNTAEMIWSLLYIMIIEQLVIYLPVITAFVKEFITNYIKSKTKQVMTKVSSNFEKVVSSILFERLYDGNSQEDYIADGLIDYIAQCKGIEFLKYTKGFYPNTKETFEIYPHINVKIIKIEQDDKGGVKALSFEVFSTKLALIELRKFINMACEESSIKKQNKIGDKLCYFNEIIQPIPVNSNGTLNYNSSNKNMKFTLTHFYTSKTLDNVFGNQIKVVKNVLISFLITEIGTHKKVFPILLDY